LQTEHYFRSEESET